MLSLITSHISWHTIWHLSHVYSDILTFYLINILIFHLAFYLAFYIAFDLAFFPTLIWHYFWHLIWHSICILSDTYSGTLSGILPGNLTYVLTCSIWFSICDTRFEHKICMKICIFFLQVYDFSNQCVKHMLHAIYHIHQYRSICMYNTNAVQTTTLTLMCIYAAYGIHSGRLSCSPLAKGLIAVFILEVKTWNGQRSVATLPRPQGLPGCLCWEHELGCKLHHRCDGKCHHLQHLGIMVLYWTLWT